MADKYIIIEKNAATRALETLASSNETMLVLKIDSENETAANTALAAIDTKYWCASDDYVVVAGMDTTDIRLPDEAVK